MCWIYSLGLPWASFFSQFGLCYFPILSLMFFVGFFCIILADLALDPSPLCIRSFGIFVSLGCLYCPHLFLLFHRFLHGELRTSVCCYFTIIYSLCTLFLSSIAIIKHNLINASTYTLFTHSHPNKTSAWLQPPRKDLKQSTLIIT